MVTHHDDYNRAYGKWRRRNYPLTLRDFTFEYVSPGHYYVTYTSPLTGKKWARLVTDMELIDATKNTDNPKKKDLIILKKYVKS